MWVKYSKVKTIETDRLILRKFVNGDLADLYAYGKLDTVGPKAGWMPHPSLEHSQKILNHFIAGNDVYALYLKSENKVIGSVGLHQTKLGEYGEVYELGYVLSTFYEGKGYMFEAVKAVLDYAFKELNLDRIYVGHFLENDRSKNLINKFNFQYLNDYDYESRDYGIKRSKIYCMTKEDYNKSGGLK